MRILIAAGIVLLSAMLPPSFARGSEKRAATPNARPSQIEQFRQMSAEERSRALRNLSPERRERVEQQLNEYEHLSPKKREQVDKAYEKFSQLPKEQQDAVRKSFKQLSPDRKQALRQEMRSLRSMTAEQRRKRMNSKEFQSEFGPDERHIMEQMTKLSSPGQSASPTHN